VLRINKLADQIPVLQRLLSLVDVAIICVASVLAHILVTWLRDGQILWPWPNDYSATVITASFISLFVFYDFGLYRGWRGESYFYDLRRITAAWSLVFISLIILAAATKTSAVYSRYWAGTWFLLTLLMFWSARVAARAMLHWVRSQGGDQKYIVLVGSGTTAKAVIEVLHANKWTGYHVDGYFGDRAAADKDDGMSIPRLGAIEDVQEYVAHSGHRQVWLALSGQEHHRFREISSKLSELTVDVRYIPDLFDFRLLNASISHVAGLPIVNISHSPMYGFNSWLKSVEDKTVALAALFILSPLIVSVALAIKLSSKGPVIFRQRRHGWHGETFEVYKFRTMHVHQENPGQITQAQKNDERISPLGRFLRRTSLDELPQLLNVLQGRMSVVGPRPHAVEHNVQYQSLIDNYAWRHKVKPGITGWAQINGFRGETAQVQDMERRVEYDLYYIEHWSLWLDFKIICLTLLKGWVSPRAY
jgi:putative colanic acid biosynthesis UDP-glucose lipid carrier transferase